MLHAIAQLDGKATQKKVRRAAESALGAPEGALDAKKAAVKGVCEDEMSKQARGGTRAKRRKIDRPADTPQAFPRHASASLPDSPPRPWPSSSSSLDNTTVRPRHVPTCPRSKCESVLQTPRLRGRFVAFTFQNKASGKSWVTAARHVTVRAFYAFKSFPVRPFRSDGYASRHWPDPC